MATPNGAHCLPQITLEWSLVTLRQPARCQTGQRPPYSRICPRVRCTAESGVLTPPFYTVSRGAHRYDRKWYECANQTDGYVFDGKSTAVNTAVSYTPTFTYHGFRYIELSAEQLLPNGIRIPLSGELAAKFPFGATVTAHRVHSGMEQIGGVALEQPDHVAPKAAATAGLIGKIFNATMASHISNVYSIPTVHACPLSPIRVVGNQTMVPKHLTRPLHLHHSPPCRTVHSARNVDVSSHAMHSGREHASFLSL